MGVENFDFTTGCRVTDLAQKIRTDCLSQHYGEPENENGLGVPSVDCYNLHGIKLLPQDTRIIGAGIAFHPHRQAVIAQKIIVVH